MFDNIQFLNDLYNYCVKHNINYYSLTYTEQLAVMRSMLVGISRRSQFRGNIYEKNS